MKFPKRQLEQLIKRNEENKLRTLKIVDGLIDFSSNDYLGISRNRLFIQKLHSDNAPIGATGSRLLSGNSRAAMDAEAYLADLFKSESALIFNSGYNANLAVLSSIPQRNDAIFYDELSHASIKDGIRLSLASKVSFKHNSLTDLEKKMSKVDGEKFVIVESAYSMDGDFCPLEELISLCKKHSAYLIIDEAHCTGLLGDNGGGLVENLGLEEEIFCRILTFGKAIGHHGAAVLGSKDLTEYLINYARPFIYTTALPPSSYSLIKLIFKSIPQLRNERYQLNENITLYNSLFEKHLETKYDRIKSDHPIQTIIIPGNSQVKFTSEELAKKGFDVRPILSPTVREGSERLRICLHSFNTSDEISNLVHSLAEL